MAPQDVQVIVPVEAQDEKSFFRQFLELLDEPIAEDRLVYYNDKDATNDLQLKVRCISTRGS